MNGPSRMSKKLDALLEQEYRALLGGDLKAIEDLGAQKVELLEKVSGLPLDDLSRFSALRLRLIRNQMLAQSAIAGMRNAITRAKDIRDVSSSLRTYRQDGQKTSVAMRSGDSLSKRS